jgi:hypothetical protein
MYHQLLWFTSLLFPRAPKTPFRKSVCALTCPPPGRFEPILGPPQDSMRFVSLASGCSRPNVPELVASLP